MSVGAPGFGGQGGSVFLHIHYQQGAVGDEAGVEAGQSIESLGVSSDLSLKMIERKQKITRPTRPDDSPWTQQRGQVRRQKIQGQQTSW